MNYSHVKHESICRELNATYMRKNADYGNSFGDMYRELGMITAVTRIGYKFNRMKSLVKNGVKMYVKDKSLRDTLIDMANYCIMTVMEMDRETEGDMQSGILLVEEPPKKKK